MQNNHPTNSRKYLDFGMFIGLGAGVGAIAGMLFLNNNISLGVGIGASLGIILNAVLGMYRRR